MPTSSRNSAALSKAEAGGSNQGVIAVDADALPCSADYWLPDGFVVVGVGRTE